MKMVIFQIGKVIDIVRNPDTEWDRTDENIEFMLVGDSFTQGACK